MLNHVQQFGDAIRAAGLVPPDQIEPGKLHRMPGIQKSGSNTAAWCKLFVDCTGGVFGDFSSGLDSSWQADRETKYSESEIAAFKARIAEERKQREAEAAQRKAEAKNTAAAIWLKATTALVDHAYLVKKGIKPSGAKLHSDGRLVIPCRAEGDIHSLQFIGPDSSKQFLPGGRVKGCYFSIGNPKGAAALCIAEGFATGATIHEATGYPVAMAFDAGNLGAVASAMRKRFSDLPLILCADDDTQTEGNPGLTKATEAARSVGGLLAIPDFGSNRPDKASDFNDMAALLGLESVRLAVGSAKLVISIERGTNPDPLPALPDVLPFDYDYLPGGLRHFVKDISERMQCPPDFAAVAAFVMMGTIIGRKVGIRPMRHNDWLVICNLWGAVVGNSGVMKSPTLSASLSPIKRLQQFAYDEFNNQIGDYAAMEEVSKLQKSVSKSEAKKKLSKDKSADVIALLKPDAGEDAPILKRYITNNASYEALGELLMETPNGLMVESDEIIGLLKQLDASGQEVARSFYLTAADGDKSYTFDRIMRGKGLHIPALCLSIIGGIQPGVLAEYVRQATGGGAGADGLLQRFGLMVYPDISPNWTEVDRYPDKVARDAVNALAERMDNLRPESIGAESDTFEAVPFLRFDDEAQALFSEWRGDLEIRLRSGEEHPAIVSHLSKYRKLIPSLALINHLCDDGIGAVSESALLRAIAFSEYLESHARRIYSYATRPDIDAAKTLLKKLSTGKLQSPFKTRDIYRAGWAGLETPAKAQAAINLLLEYRHLNDEEVSTGGRATTQYSWIREVAE